MATVREHFDIDPRTLTIHADWGMLDLAGATHPPITAKIFQDLDGNAKYWSFFIPGGVDFRGYSKRYLFETGNFSLSTPCRWQRCTGVVRHSRILGAGIVRHAGPYQANTLVC